MLIPGVGNSLFVSATVPPPGAGATTLDYGCFYAQQDYTNGVAEFKAAHAANDQAAMDAAGTKLRGAGEVQPRARHWHHDARTRECVPELADT